MSDQPKLAIPSIHLNGTSEDELLSQIEEAMHQLQAAQGALSAAAPNARDYYVQKDKDAFKNATRQHEARVRKVQDVIDELLQIGEAINDGGFKEP